MSQRAKYAAGAQGLDGCGKGHRGRVRCIASSRIESAAEAHIDDVDIRATGEDPVEARDNIQNGPAAGGVESFDCDQVGAVRGAEWCRSPIRRQYTMYARAVAVIIIGCARPTERVSAPQAAVVTETLFGDQRVRQIEMGAVDSGVDRGDLYASAVVAGRMKGREASQGDGFCKLDFDAQVEAYA